MKKPLFPKKTASSSFDHRSRWWWTFLVLQPVYLHSPTISNLSQTMVNLSNRDNAAAAAGGSATTHMPLPEFAKYIPMRLSPEERSLLNVLENTLHVSEYTDHVDVTSARRGIISRRVLDGISEVLHIATGLAVASGHERSLLSEEAWKESTASSSAGTKSTGGSNMLFRRHSEKKKKKKKHKKKRKNGSAEDEGFDNENDAVEDGDKASTEHDAAANMSFASRDPNDNAILFQTMFEVGRRNKVLNPNQMRTTYGKMMVSCLTLFLLLVCWT